MEAQVKVIGHFVPSRLQSEILEAEIKAYLPPCCAAERVGVRTPQPKVVAHPDNLEWHQDGGGPLGTIRHMIVWASEQPTEVQCSDGSVFVGEPYDLVWFDNDLAHHRQPRGTNEQERWFLGIRCSGACQA